VLTGSWDGTVRLWDIPTGQLLQVLECSPAKVPIRTVEWSSDHATILITSWDGKTHRWKRLELSDLWESALKLFSSLTFLLTSCTKTERSLLGSN
nr:hypothetical protein [Candidatus Dependentiae bacterium]